MKITELADIIMENRNVRFGIAKNFDWMLDPESEAAYQADFLSLDHSCIGRAWEQELYEDWSGAEDVAEYLSGLDEDEKKDLASAIKEVLSFWLADILSDLLRDGYAVYGIEPDDSGDWIYETTQQIIGGEYKDWSEIKAEIDHYAKLVKEFNAGVKK